MFKPFFYRLPQRVVACYTNGRWVWHMVAALLTATLVLSGFDWWFFEATRSSALYPLVWLAGLGGFFVPVLLPLVLWVAGKRRVSAGVAQAEIIGYLITTFYKVFTGRTQPEFLTHVNSVDISHNFHFGFLQNGVFWGWPSSHAGVAVAGMAALYLAWPNRAVRIAAVAWASVVCIGAAIGFHWFSDVIAGIIIGIVAGVAVWRDTK